MLETYRQILLELENLEPIMNAMLEDHTQLQVFTFRVHLLSQIRSSTTCIRMTQHLCTKRWKLGTWFSESSRRCTTRTSLRMIISFSKWTVEASTEMPCNLLSMRRLLDCKPFAPVC